jgi:Zn finger protein HypA/HybF involved in hydrogenase expression
MGKPLVKIYRDLEVYQTAFSSAMEIFEVSKTFPVEERYALTDQIRRSSRSVCANLGEAWRKRRYIAAFIAKLYDCQADYEPEMGLQYGCPTCRSPMDDIRSGRELKIDRVEYADIPAPL